MLHCYQYHKMVVTNKYIFTHIPKTGGTTCLRILKQINRGRRLELQPLRAPFHSFIDYDSYDQDIKPIFSLVRNPIDWYQSWYFWAKSTTFDRMLFDSLVTVAGTVDIDTIITTLLTIDEDTNLSELLHQELLINKSIIGLSRKKPFSFLTTLSQPDTYVQDRLALNQGHLGWMVDRVDNDNLPVSFGKTETLKEDLTTFLDELLTLTDNERDIIKDGHASGVRPDSARVELKQATKDLIQKKEKVIIDRFGY